MHYGYLTLRWTQTSLITHRAVKTPSTLHAAANVTQLTVRAATAQAMQLTPAY
jgi:hypothetical protein